jgi:hypothetical protein
MIGIDMAQAGTSLPICVTFAGSALGVVGGLVAQSSPDASTGTAGVYVGISGVILGAASLIGVLSDKFMPRYIEYSKMRAETAEEFRKNAEARHRLTSELQAQKFEMDELRAKLAEATEKADKSENLAIEAAAKLATVEKYTQERIGRVEGVAGANSARLSAVEATVAGGSGDAIPTTTAAGPGGA